jgi:hypothetical protein
MPTDADLARLEAKVDKLTDAVMRLILIEERQSSQGERIGAVEQRTAAVETAVAKTDRVLHMWINRGIGVWGLVVVLFTLYQVAGKLK